MAFTQQDLAHLAVYSELVHKNNSSELTRYLALFGETSQASKILHKEQVVKHFEYLKSSSVLVR